MSTKPADRFLIQQRVSNLVRTYAEYSSSYDMKEATAQAYTSLLLEDPEIVTDRHIKILTKLFTRDQIIAITTCVLEDVFEKAYVEAFRLRCGRILKQEPAVI